VIAAITERYNFVNTGTYTPSSTNSVGKRRASALETLKTDVSSLVGSFKRVTSTNDIAALIPIGNYSSSTILFDLEMPSNYFTYTPHRGRSGLGGYTNQVSFYGHIHGETNSFTAAGGTNYPSGQTAWTTSDYGWMGLYRILNTLEYATISTNITSERWIVDYWQGRSTNEVWAAAKTEAEADFAYNGTYTNRAFGNSVAPSQRTYGDASGPFYANMYGDTSGTYEFDHPDTNVSARVLTFVCADDPAQGANTNIVYDSYYYPFPQTNWYQYGASAYTNAATVGTTYSVTNAVLSPWCSEPVVNDTSRGFIITDFTHLFQCDFEYNGD